VEDKNLKENRRIEAVCYASTARCLKNLADDCISIESNPSMINDYFGGNGDALKLLKETVLTSRDVLDPNGIGDTKDLMVSAEAGDNEAAKYCSKLFREKFISDGGIEAFRKLSTDLKEVAEKISGADSYTSEEAVSANLGMLYGLTGPIDNVVENPHDVELLRNQIDAGIEEKPIESSKFSILDTLVTAQFNIIMRAMNDLDSMYYGASEGSKTPAK
jgi:hypothetical protein